jgi:hypothetical protein
VRVAAADISADGQSEIFTAPGAGLAARIRTFDGATGAPGLEFTAYDSVFLGGAWVGGLAPVTADSAVTRTFDFRTGDAQGWVAGFTDWPGDDPIAYQLDSGIRPLPAEIGPGSGFMIQGLNGSDDLFMFLKRRLTTADGIVPGQAYRVRFEIDFGSNAPIGLGVGGAPGESVHLKAGAGSQEPLEVPTPGGIRLNVDKGDQSAGGRFASVLGNIANGRAIDPSLPEQPFLNVERAGTHAFFARADAAGNLWLLVGTDSGFEGLTRLFYQQITVTLLPLET